MKILFVGEFSGLHNNLSDALKEMGHSTNIAATGDGYKHFPYDIYFAHQIGKDNSLYKTIFKLNTKLQFYQNKRIFQNNDVVQLINPIFHVPDLILLNIFSFSLLRKYNKSIYLGAFGDDYFWIKACLEGLFRYNMISENISRYSPDEHLFDAIQTSFSKPAKQLNEYIASNVNGIIAGAFEYFQPYKTSCYSNKTCYIPFPINISKFDYQPNIVKNGKIRILLGMQKGRQCWKGTNVLLSILNKIREKYPSDFELITPESLPYIEYIKLYKTSNVVIDQLYSYSPAINALNALASGKIVLGGGEPEAYNLLNEDGNFPIINLIPDSKKIEKAITELLESRQNFEMMGEQGRKYVEKHHDHRNIAQKYLEYWKNNC